MAYAQNYKITLNKAQCGASDQTDFAVLLDLNGFSWAQRGGGGQVQNHGSQTVGGTRTFNVPADLIFTSDAAGTTLLNWEWDDYTDASGGTVWIKIPTLNGSANGSSTVIYAWVNDPTVNTFQGNVAGTWNSAFKYVGHLTNGITPNGLDSTNQFNGTLGGSPSAATGKIDGAISFSNASSQFIDLGTGSGLNPTAITVALWVKATSFPNSFNAVYCRGGANFAFYIDGSGQLHPFMSVTGSGSFLQYTGGVSGSHTIPTNGTWHHLVLVYDSTNGLIGYYDSAVDGTAAANGTLDTTAIGSNNSYVAGDSLNGRYWDGVIDEVQISNVARSADWVTTSYNNQNSPGSFATILQIQKNPRSPYVVRQALNRSGTY